MRKLITIAGLAAMAVSTPALAEKGGKGGGGGGKPDKAAHAHGGGGKPDKAQGGHSGHASKPHKAERQAFRAPKAHKAERQALHAAGKADKAFRKAGKHQERAGRDGFEFRGREQRNLRESGERRFVSLTDSCPPGLARKGNGCLPPGQAKKMFRLGDRVEPNWFGGAALPGQYRSLYYDTDEYYYRYDDDGYIYRVAEGSDMIDALIPLLGGGFAVGQPLPAGYDAYNVPLQYRDAYQDGDDSLYRYGDDAIYRVDAESGIIESIVALLGGGLNVGEALPSGYDAYNLPIDYRDEYYDSDESLYRYADGNIYQVDAKTQIIQAIVEMLV
jgi:hypothetical protein